MSMQTPITVVLANRPRLFRELLQHALNTATPQFRVVEVADGAPSTAILRDADWVVVDEDSVIALDKVVAAHPHLGVFALEGHGSRARLREPGGAWQQLSDVPSLSELFSLLSKATVRENISARQAR